MRMGELRIYKHVFQPDIEHILCSVAQIVSWFFNLASLLGYGIFLKQTTF